MPEEQTTALIKKDSNLPVLDTVKNRNGEDRIVARQKGRFTKTATARVLATQKVVEKVMSMPDEKGKNQLQRILESQAKVCEDNTDARNVGSITKFIEITDEISGTKAAREALTREINVPVIPTVIFLEKLMLNEPIDYEKEVREAAERDKRGPSWLRAEVVSTNG